MSKIKSNRPTSGAEIKKRKSLRFAPDLAAFAYIDINTKSKNFAPEFTALIIEESFGGAYLVLRSSARFIVDLELTIKPGNLAPMKAQIRWIKKLSEKVTEIGIEYLV